MESPKTYNNKTRKGTPAACGRPDEHGFTLIELSIVLVIIGLIVGGILVGQDLIKAAEIRATVGQVEKYNSSVNTFRTKYNGIPGDITAPQATAFGLFAETTAPGTTGHQDGNGVIEGGSSGAVVALGETLDFWRHLSDANLIDGQFGVTGNSAIGAGGAVATAVTAPQFSLPPTKTTPNNFFTVYSVAGLNYLQIAPISGFSTAGVYTVSSVGLTPIQAYNMDIKLDDGLPWTGIVQARGTGATMNADPSGASSSTNNNCDLQVGGASATTDTYNRAPTTGGNDGSCSLRFRFN